MQKPLLACFILFLLLIIVPPVNSNRCTYASSCGYCGFSPEGSHWACGIFKYLCTPTNGESTCSCDSGGGYYNCWCYSEDVTCNTEKFKCNTDGCPIESGYEGNVCLLSDELTGPWSGYCYFEKYGRWDPNEQMCVGCSGPLQSKKVAGSDERCYKCVGGNWQEQTCAGNIGQSCEQACDATIPDACDEKIPNVEDCRNCGYYANKKCDSNCQCPLCQSTCTLDSDCASGYVCDDDNSKCKSCTGPIETGGTNPNNKCEWKCGADYLCDEKNPGDSCGDGRKCQNDCTCPGECTSDSQCAAGYKCCLGSKECIPESEYFGEPGYKRLEMDLKNNHLLCEWAGSDCKKAGSDYTVSSPSITDGCVCPAGIEYCMSNRCMVGTTCYHNVTCLGLNQPIQGWYTNYDPCSFNSYCSDDETRYYNGKCTGVAGCKFTTEDCSYKTGLHDDSDSLPCPGYTYPASAKQERNYFCSPGLAGTRCNCTVTYDTYISSFSVQGTTITTIVPRTTKPGATCKEMGGTCMSGSQGCIRACQSNGQLGYCDLGDPTLGYYPGCRPGDCCCLCTEIGIKKVSVSADKNIIFQASFLNTGKDSQGADWKFIVEAYKVSDYNTPEGAKSNKATMTITDTGGTCDINGCDCTYSETNPNYGVFDSGEVITVTCHIPASHFGQTTGDEGVMFWVKAINRNQGILYAEKSPADLVVVITPGAGPTTTIGKYNLKVDPMVDGTGKELMESRGEKVWIVVDNQYKETLDGYDFYPLSFSISPGFHKIWADMYVDATGRPFSHFWDHDCDENNIGWYLDSEYNPYIFTSYERDRWITPFYKIVSLLQINSNYDGSTLKGTLTNEDGSAIFSGGTAHETCGISTTSIPINRNVSLYYEKDGSWNYIGSAPSDGSGNWQYSWKCIPGTTRLKAMYSPTDWYYLPSYDIINKGCDLNIKEIYVFERDGKSSGECFVKECYNGKCGPIDGTCPNFKCGDNIAVDVMVENRDSAHSIFPTPTKANLTVEFCQVSDCTRERKYCKVDRREITIDSYPKRFSFPASDFSDMEEGWHLGFWVYLEAAGIMFPYVGDDQYFTPPRIDNSNIYSHSCCPHMEYDCSPSQVTAGQPVQCTIKYTHDEGDAGRAHFHFENSKFTLNEQGTNCNKAHSTSYYGIYRIEECDVDDKDQFTINIIPTQSGTFNVYSRVQDIVLDEDCGSRCDYSRDPDSGTCSANCDIGSSGYLVNCNSKSMPIVVSPALTQKPDLTIREVNTTDSKLFYEIVNLGAATTSQSTTKLKVNGGLKDQHRDPALNGGGVLQFTLNSFNWREQCNSGNFNYEVCADANVPGEVDESNEGNNCLSGTWNCPKPDLVVESIEVSYLPDKAVVVCTNIKNKGDAKAASDFVNGLYLDGSTSSYDTCTIAGSLVTGGFGRCCFEAFGCTSGSHTVKVSADTGNAIPEGSNEGNNDLSQTIPCLGEVVYPPDLLIESVDYSEASNRIQYKIANRGDGNAGPSYAALWIDGSHIASDYVGDLNSNFYMNEEFIESVGCSGTEDKVSVCADYQGQVDESNENNNCFNRTIICDRCNGTLALTCSHTVTSDEIWGPGGSGYCARTGVEINCDGQYSYCVDSRIGPCSKLQPEIFNYEVSSTSIEVGKQFTVTVNGNCPPDLPGNCLLSCIVETPSGTKKLLSWDKDGQAQMAAVTCTQAGTYTVNSCSACTDFGSNGGWCDTNETITMITCTQPAVPCSSTSDCTKTECRGKDVNGDGKIDCCNYPSDCSQYTCIEEQCNSNVCDYTYLTANLQKDGCSGQDVCYDGKCVDPDSNLTVCAGKGWNYDIYAMFDAYQPFCCGDDSYEYYLGPTGGKACCDSQYECVIDNKCMEHDIEAEDATKNGIPYYNCKDGIDNDCDGLVDCEDPDCSTKPGPIGFTCCVNDDNCDSDSCTETGGSNGGGTCHEIDNYCDANGHVCKTKDTSFTDYCSGTADTPSVTYYSCNANKCEANTNTKTDFCSDGGGICNAVNWICESGQLKQQTVDTNKQKACSVNKQSVEYYVCEAKDGSTTDTCSIRHDYCAGKPDSCTCDPTTLECVACTYNTPGCCDPVCTAYSCDTNYKTPNSANCPSGYRCENDCTCQATSPTQTSDLIVTDIENVDGKIQYLVINRGNLDVTVNTHVSLSVDSVSQGLSILAPGDIKKYKEFEGYTWECSGDQDWIEVCADANNEVSESDEYNNCRMEIWPCPVTTTTTTTSSTTTVTKQPDLKITNISESNGKIKYRIKNYGLGWADAYSLQSLEVDGTYVESDYFDYIPPLSPMAYLDSEFSAYDWLCTGTNDAIQVCADSSNAVTESREDNNCLNKTLICDRCVGTTALNCQDRSTNAIWGNGNCGRTNAEINCGVAHTICVDKTLGPCSTIEPAIYDYTVDDANIYVNQKFTVLVYGNCPTEYPNSLPGKCLVYCTVTGPSSKNLYTWDEDGQTAMPQFTCSDPGTYTVDSCEVCTDFTGNSGWCSSLTKSDVQVSCVTPPSTCSVLSDCKKPECWGVTISGKTCCDYNNGITPDASYCKQDDCVSETCQSDYTCSYSNRPKCDKTECDAGEYCNAAGGNCTDPDSDSTVCSCSNVGGTWSTTAMFEAYRPYCCGDDNYEYYLGPTGGKACCDTSGECVRNGVCQDYVPAATETDCTDMKDNDCDGLVDCADHPDCDGKQGLLGTCCASDANCPSDVVDVNTGDDTGGGACSATDNWCSATDHVCKSYHTEGTDFCAGDPDQPTVVYYDLIGSTCVQKTHTETDSCNVGSVAENWYCTEYPGRLVQVLTSPKSGCYDIHSENKSICTAKDGSIADTIIQVPKDCGSTNVSCYCDIGGTNACKACSSTQECYNYQCKNKPTPEPVCKLSIVSATPPPNTTEGDRAESTVDVVNSGNKSCYGYVKCNYTRPDKTTVTPWPDECNPVINGTDVLFKPGINTVPVTDRGKWTVERCDLLNSTNINCGDPKFPVQTVTSVGYFWVITTSTTTTTSTTESTTTTIKDCKPTCQKLTDMTGYSYPFGYCRSPGTCQVHEFDYSIVMPLDPYLTDLICDPQGLVCCCYTTCDSCPSIPGAEPLDYCLLKCEQDEIISRNTAYDKYFEIASAPDMPGYGVRRDITVTVTPDVFTAHCWAYWDVFTGECPGPSCVNPYCEDCGGNVCTLDESEHDRSMLSSSRILVNKDSGTGTSFNISLLCQPPGSLGAAGAGAVTTLPTGEKGISTAIIPIVETTTLTTTTKPATTTEVVATTETTTVYWEKGMPVQLSILDRIRQIIFGIIGLRV